MKILVWVATLLLVGCESHSFKAAKDQVRSMLVDPQSAQWEDLRLIKREGERTLVCGKVNARNQMGGYVGFRHFIVADDQDAALAADQAESSRISLCCSTTSNFYRWGGTDAAVDTSISREGVTEACKRIPWNPIPMRYR